MPFAKKFRAMMDLPLPGDLLGEFEVEDIQVTDEGSDWRGYQYKVVMVLHGPGGKEGARRTLAPILGRRATTFSSYGNPYELWFGRPEIRSLGDKRYSVSVAGGGARIDIAPELERFVDYLEAEGHLTGQLANHVIEAYLEDYRVDVARGVDRYRRALRRQMGTPD